MMNPQHSAATAEAFVPIAFPFTRDRYVHTLLKRHGDVCLVERTNQFTESVHYEVVVLRYMPARIGPRGNPLPACEMYPSSAMWGVAGWTYTSRDDAERRWECLFLCVPSA